MTVALIAAPRPAVVQPMLPLGQTPPLPPSALDRGVAEQLRPRAGQFMQAVVEVLCGERPARQLGCWVTAEILEQLLLATVEPRRSTRIRGKLASVHVSMPHHGAAEITARMVVSGRSRALAARLDRDLDLHGRPVWRCTTLWWA